MRLGLGFSLKYLEIFFHKSINKMSAEIIFLHELHHSYQLEGISSVANRLIRIAGRIVSLDYPERLCLIQDDEHELKLWIDISLIDMSLLKCDHLFQFIGSTDVTDRPIVRNIFMIVLCVNHIDFI
jgi:hypothetical protein